MPPRTLDGWDPEDESQWENGGKRIACRNLAISVYTLSLAFAVWVLWSVVVVYLPDAGFDYSQTQLFLLTAIPSLVGATGRLFYSFAVPVFGGRRFNTFATATLLVPTAGLVVAVQYPETPFWLMALLAATAGFGGANFSSSMDHISYFFPERAEGTALGINAGIGNLGVSVAQFSIPFVIGVGIFGAVGGSGLETTTGETLWLQNAGLVWIPFILLGTVASAFGLNDVADVEANVREQLTILRRKHNWLLCYLYLGTFGSFLGYAAAFPLLAELRFPGRDVAAVAFVGPLLGALIRPPGGWVADRLGGARVTLWVFATMSLGCVLVIYFVLEGSFWGFFGAFLLLFLASGIGNASTFKLIPAVFRRRHLARLETDTPEARRRALERAELEAGSVLGFTSGIGAYGGFLIPQGFSTSVELTDAAVPAMGAFLLFYLSCIVLTWYYYCRPGTAVSPN
ncbi:MFS transporter [Halobiforma nitratireducens]|uniref:Nitrite extrusion protein n=1 Tax=Halobiforma nitratireducens JCM 10879 TaxID=1227454 RepID=M0LTD3_9EURY|nr:MFS transporter [Halobiforma nitratireducens]EMA35654.1 nitrite extrusion protein [Halobiforma nitratireducens JCM 10879]